MSAWLTPWDWTSSDWSGLTFLVLVAAALVAWRHLGEAKRLREEQARPFVVIDFHPWSTVIELVIKNVGTTLARDVRFNFDQTPVTTHDDESGRGKFAELNLFKHGIPSLAPGKEIKLFFDRFPTRFEEGLPMKYDVTVSYRDPSGKSYSEPTVLDLDMYLGTGGITRHDVHDVHKRLEEIVREMRKWTQWGLKVMTPDDIKRRNEEMDALHAERVAAAQAEKGNGNGTQAQGS